MLASKPHFIKPDHMLDNRLSIPPDVTLEVTSSAVSLETPRVSPRSPRPRSNGLRPNLSPLSTSNTRSTLNTTTEGNLNNTAIRSRNNSRRPNLSPLSTNNINSQPTTNIEHTNSHNDNPILVDNPPPRVAIPTPVNMTDRFQPQGRDLSFLGLGSPFRNFVRRFSPRANINNRSGTFTPPTPMEEPPVRRTLTDLPLRRVSPSYSDNIQSLFPDNMLDIHELMAKLLASNPPTPSPVLRRFRIFTPKVLRKSPKSRNSKVALGSSPLSKPPINAQESSLLDEAPIEVYEMIFSMLDSPQDLINCSLTCKKWKQPAQSVLQQLIKRRPYVELPMLQSLRLGLKQSGLTNLSSPEAHDTLRQISVEYCQSNPSLYRKFSPKNPEAMVHTVFLVFHFFHRSLHVPHHIGIGTDSLQSITSRLRGTVYPDLEKATLTDIYNDIKATPLLEETHDLNDNVLVLLVDDPEFQPRRRWWQRIWGRGSDDIEEDDDYFRPLD